MKKTSKGAPARKAQTPRSVWDNFDDSVTSSSRKDDEIGVFWQKIDKWEEFVTQAGMPALRLHKTTIVRLAGDGEQGPGDETTQVFFNDPRYSYFERETRDVVRAAYNLDRADSDRIPGAMLREIAESDELVGMVLEFKVGRKKKAEDDDSEGEGFLKAVPKRRVTFDEVKQALTDGKITKNQLKTIFPSPAEDFVDYDPSDTEAFLERLPG